MPHSHYAYDWITFQTEAEYMAAVVNSLNVMHFRDDLKRICIVREYACESDCDLI